MLTDHMGWHLLDNMKAFTFISEIAFIVYYAELGMYICI